MRDKRGSHPSQSGETLNFVAQSPTSHRRGGPSTIRHQPLDLQYRAQERRSLVNYLLKGLKNLVNRRSFMKNGLVATGAASVGVGLLANGSSVFAQEPGPEESSGSLTAGDAAILRFLAAAEIIESDLWVQYNELGGIQNNEVPGI